jgi:hypothetical protein
MCSWPEGWIPERIFIEITGLRLYLDLTAKIPDTLQQKHKKREYGKQLPYSLWLKAILVKKN